MTSGPSATEHLLIAQLLDTLRGLPEVHAEPASLAPGGVADADGIDALVTLQIAGRLLRLAIETKKAVYPRDVHQVLWRHWPSRRGAAGEPGREEGVPHSEETVPFLVAESISPGAKDLLREQRVGYFDSGGSLCLPVSGAYIYIDKPPPKSLSKSMRSLFSGSRAQVLHTLLIHHQQWFGGKELAGQALVSPATASQVLTELERFEWLASRGQGPGKERRLREPAALLDAWVNQLSLNRPPVLRRYYIPSLKTDGVLERIGQVFAANEVEYEVSHEAAAQRYAPFLSNVSQVRCRVMVGRAAEAAISELGGRIVSEGANLAVIEVKSPGELLFREWVGGVWLASPIRVYLDLLGGEGRAREMAEHLRKERIGF